MSTIFVHFKTPTNKQTEIYGCMVIKFEFEVKLSGTLKTLWGFVYFIRTIFFCALF